ncbi:MAG TPA: hypothetical protein VFM18_05275 [Methanosarcina sp.]|nr:hypothetical protein [Methanosarcina sp.]
MALNARANLVRRKEAGVDPLVDKILTQGTPESELYARSTKIYTSAVKRSYVEACLLSSSDYKRMSDILELDADLLKMYHDVYYDVNHLDRLSRLELIDVTDKNEGLMKLWALNQGLDFIAWRLGQPISINPTAGLQDLFSTCVMKSKEAMFSGNASEESKGAVQWTKLAMDIARLLRTWVMDTEGARKDIELALKESNPEFEGFASLQEETDPEPIR